MASNDLLLRLPAGQSLVWAVALVFLGVFFGMVVATTYPATYKGLFDLPIPDVSWMILAAFTVAGILSLFLRRGWRIRHGASELWQWRGLTRLRMETPHRIPVQRRVEIVKTQVSVRTSGSGHSSTRKVDRFPVRITPDSADAPSQKLGSDSVSLYSGQHYELSRRIAEQVCKQLHCALHDASFQEVRIRPWEYLDESIGQRMRRLKEQVRVPAQPTGSGVRVEIQHDRTSIKIPRPGFSTTYLWFVGICLLVMGLFFGPVMLFGSEAIESVLYMCAFVGFYLAGIVAFLALHREEISINADGLSYRKGILPWRTRRMPLNEIEEVLVPEDLAEKIEGAVKGANPGLVDAKMAESAVAATGWLLNAMNSMGVIGGIQLHSDLGSHELGWRLSPAEKIWFHKLLLQQIGRHDRSTTQPPIVNGQVMDMRPTRGGSRKRWVMTAAILFIGAAVLVAFRGGFGL